MGWKNIKEHYRIEHNVHVDNNNICIGSGYISDLIVINPEGKLVKRYVDGSNVSLLRYQAEMDADPELLQRLLQQPDQFTASIPVFTYRGSEMVEKYCETPGWPNATHDGEMMYQNTFSTDRQTVVEWAKNNAAAGIQMYERMIQDTEKELARLRESLARCQSDLQKLAEQSPGAAENTN